MTELRFDVRRGCHVEGVLLDFCVEVGRDFIDPQFTREQALWSLREGELVSVWLDEKPIGLAHFCLHESRYSDRLASMVSALYVRPAYRGRVGLRLIRKVEALSRMQGAQDIAWAVTDERLVLTLILLGYSAGYTVCTRGLRDE